MTGGEKDSTPEVNTGELQKILAFLRRSETAVVATNAGEEIRLRVMHLGTADDLTIYLATMHNDPKVVQLANHPSVAILVSNLNVPVTEAEEVEYTGRAMLIRNEEERRHCLDATARTSPVVQSLVQSGQAAVLDCLKIVPTRVKYRKFKEIIQGVPPTVIEFEQKKKNEGDLQALRIKLRSWWTALRPNSLAASLTAVILGGALAYYEQGSISLWLFSLTLLAALAAQAGLNVFNDYWDYHGGSDNSNQQFIRPFSGGSRVIQLGLLSPLEILAGGSILCLLALFLGLYLGFRSGPAVYLLILAGLASGLFYNLPGLNLIRLGLGEVAVGFNFGLLLTAGTYYVLTGHLTLTALAASLPVAILITAVIYINEFPDWEADSGVGKATLVVRWGREKAARNLKWFFVAAYGYLLAGLALGFIPLWSALALLPGWLAWSASAHAAKHHGNMIDLAPANGWTATAHLATGLFLALGYVAEALGKGGLFYTLLLAALFLGTVYWLTAYTERLRLASLTVRERFSAYEAQRPT